ncbi:MAG TPA: hypothetical protein VG963_23020, partial [Polyangiaceae bacterium]|nr:hypothetical protein [Polyangiaceae bacterium]
MSAGARRELTRALRTSSIVRRSPTIVWGIDWVEVTPDGSSGFRLGVWFSCSAPLDVPPGLEPEDFSLETVSRQPAPGWVLSDLHVDDGHVSLHLSRSPTLGPWTDANLVLVYHGPLDAEGNASVDPLRARHPLSFSESTAAPEQPAASPGGDQVVGDYAATRAGLLQRLALTAPDWQERSEADPWMALLDLLAWAGDQLAAYQDAVATEAWLSTARRRLSVRRHARLLGFSAHDGSSARAWLALSPQVPYPLPAGFAFSSDAAADPGEPHVFHVLEPAALSPELESIPLYTWGAASWTLPAGTIELALQGSAPGLDRGALLLFPGQHVARVARLERTTDPLTAEAITSVELFAEDALPAELEASGTCVSANVVLIAEGARSEFSEPPEVAAHGRLRYALRGRRLACVEPFVTAESRQRAA